MRHMPVRCTPMRCMPHEVYPHKTKLVGLDCDSKQSAGYYSRSAKLSIRRLASLPVVERSAHALDAYSRYLGL
jgi:hypothetical protein